MTVTREIRGRCLRRSWARTVRFSRYSPRRKWSRTSDPMGLSWDPMDRSLDQMARSSRLMGRWDRMACRCSRSSQRRHRDRECCLHSRSSSSRRTHILRLAGRDRPRDDLAVKRTVNRTRLPQVEANGGARLRLFLYDGWRASARPDAIHSVRRAVYCWHQPPPPGHEDPSFSSRVPFRSVTERG